MFAALPMYMATVSGAVLAEARSPEMCIGLTHECQEPKIMNDLLLPFRHISRELYQKLSTRTHSCTHLEWQHGDGLAYKVRSTKGPILAKH